MVWDQKICVTCEDFIRRCGRSLCISDEAGEFVDKSVLMGHQTHPLAASMASHMRKHNKGELICHKEAL